nr:Dioxygenase TauD/TfdA [uncultured bacterium]
MTNLDGGTADWKKSWAQKRKENKPRGISGSQEELIHTGFLNDRELPLVVEPSLRSVDLIDWLRSNMELVHRKLLQHGGILFRGFGLKGNEGFARFLEATSIPLMHYREGATPRNQVGEKVYTSTEFPADQRIALHNELNYVQTWPTKIWFYCLTAPAVGGETPIADVRRVFDRLRPEVRDPFVEKGWMLIRNFGDGFGPSWQSSYRVQDRQQLEEYLRSADVPFEWKDGDRVRTRQVRPAIARHPKTGETVWFNHVAFWHVSSLEPKLRQELLSEFGEKGLPYNTFYGDGTRIPDAVVAELRDAYDAETVQFPWQEGDVLMLDNMLVAHGRSPFSGPRLILTSMGEPCSDRGLDRIA